MGILATSSQNSTSDNEKTTAIEKETVNSVDLKVDNINAEDGLPPIDPEALKKLTWKCDLYVIPPLFVLFLLAFLDRTNIGNAKIQGLEKGLNMSGDQYNMALYIFFIPYILLEG